MPEIFSQKLTTDIRNATIILGFENEASVVIKHDLVPVDLSEFNYFILTGIGGSVIHSINNFGSIRSGNRPGEIVLNLGKFIKRKGNFNTKLVGYSSDNSEGVVLWHPLIARASLRLKVTKA